MNYVIEIKDIIVKIIESIRKGIKNKINSVKGKIYKAQVEAENKSSGLSMKDIRNELQCALYSTGVGKFLISFCQYIMYALVCCEIVVFFFRESTNPKVINISFQLGMIEIFLAVIIGCICYIKNKNMPIFIYAMVTAITYFLKLTEHLSYGILNVFIVIIMIAVSVFIIKTFIKDKEVNGIMGLLGKMFNIEEEDNEKVSRTEIMIRCPKCGGICSKDDSTCTNCGEVLRLQRRVERNSKKTVNKKASTIIKKSVKKANSAINSGKNNSGNKNGSMGDIEEKIRRNADD